MSNSLITFAKTIYQKIVPDALRRRVWELRHWKKVRKHIVGKNNRIVIGNGGGGGGVNNITFDIIGGGNLIQMEDNVSIKNVTFDIVGSGNTIQIGDGACINNTTFTIRGNNNKYIIHKNVLFMNVLLNINCMVFSISHNTFFEVGDNTYIGAAFFHLLEKNSKLIIGRDCMLSNDINIYTGDGHPIFDRKSGERINIAKDTIINDHVWIGAHATILKDVIIPKGSVVGACSVVTKPFEENNVIIAGSPAKIVKRNIDWKK